MRKKLSGVKLAHHKNTANTASQPLPLPKRVRIPMSMHIGAPCSPLVKVRDSICVGQKIGDTDAFMAAPIHSGVSGTVKAVSDFRMSNGRTCKCVEIETDCKRLRIPYSRQSFPAKKISCTPFGKAVWSAWVGQVFQPMLS